MTLLRNGIVNLLVGDRGRAWLRADWAMSGVALRPAWSAR
jgi:hypothetical protein